ncbi:MAG: glycosyl transferase [Planctomycetota bacterium]|nr:MAG: glycosyl transferase [Planctomycetota bacterium]
MAETVKQGSEIAVLIPCHNEELTIGKVIDDFRSQLPQADIYVFNNCSTDATAEIAIGKGATVINEPRKGKGFVVESMFSKIDADIYVMVDGDDTYLASEVCALINPIRQNRADCVVGARLTSFSKESFRPLHVLGNNLVRRLVNWIGKANLTDIMSGYRAFNRRVVRTIPVVSAGFEVETEMTLQMLQHRIKIVEVQIPYKERPAGSESKLNTFRDGFRVLWKIFRLFREFKPLTFFGSVGIIFFILSVIAGLPSIHDYISDPDHYVRHIPSAILATGLMLLSAGNVFLGILLHSLNWKFRELHNVLTRSRVIGN